MKERERQRDRKKEKEKKRRLSFGTVLILTAMEPILFSLWLCSNEKNALSICVMK